MSAVTDLSRDLLQDRPANSTEPVVQRHIKAAEQGTMFPPKPQWTQQPSPSPVPGSHRALNEPLPKASGGFSHASSASIGIVFLPPQWPNQLWEHPLLLLPALYSGPRRRRDTTEKAHAFTSAFARIQRRNSNCSDMHACAHVSMTTSSSTPCLPLRGTLLRMWEREISVRNSLGLTTVLQTGRRGAEVQV